MMRVTRRKPDVTDRAIPLHGASGRIAADRLGSPRGARITSCAGKCAVKILRVRHRVLQSPVIRYQHRKTGRTVTLVATCHIGEAAYYKKLYAMVAEMESAGALIHYERVSPATNKDWAAATSAERAARHVLSEQSGQAFQAACRHLGWVQQYALPIPPSWHNIDMTDLEVARRAGPQNLLEFEPVSDLSTLLAQDQQDVRWGTGVALMYRLLPIDRLQLSQRWSDTASDATRHIGRVIVADRTSSALDSLPPDGNAVLLWGAGHLPGLGAGLKKTGYQRQATTWVNVGELPPVWSSIRALWPVLRQLWPVLRQ